MVGDWEERIRACQYKAAAVARETGVTLRYLESYFHARFGITPRAWIFRLRMVDAGRLLNHASAVKVVALDLGYNRTGNFSRNFKRYYGATPREYLLKQTKFKAKWA